MADDRKSAGYPGDRYDGAAKLVAAPVASQGVRNALRNAFSCDKNSTEYFDRLLAKLR